MSLFFPNTPNTKPYVMQLKHSEQKPPALAQTIPRINREHRTQLRPQGSDISELHRALSSLLPASVLIRSFSKHSRKPYFLPHVVGLTVVQGPDPVTFGATDDHVPAYATMRTHHRAGSG